MQVLRRYLLHTRVTVGGGVSEAAVNGVPTPNLDDRGAAVVAARELAVKPYYRLSPELHLRLLTALCGDALSCGPMRAVINERETSMSSLHTERLKEVQEEKRKAKEEEVQRREELRRVASATQAAFEASAAADRVGRADFDEPPGGSMVELPPDLQVVCRLHPYDGFHCSFLTTSAQACARSRVCGLH